MKLAKYDWWRHALLSLTCSAFVSFLNIIVAMIHSKNSFSGEYPGYGRSWRPSPKRCRSDCTSEPSSSSDGSSADDTDEEELSSEETSELEEAPEAQETAACLEVSLKIVVICF